MADLKTVDANEKPLVHDFSNVSLPKVSDDGTDPDTGKSEAEREALVGEHCARM